MVNDVAMLVLWAEQDELDTLVLRKDRMPGRPVDDSVRYRSPATVTSNSPYPTTAVNGLQASATTPPNRCSGVRSSANTIAAALRTVARSAEGMWSSRCPLTIGFIAALAPFIPKNDPIASTGINIGYCDAGGILTLSESTLNTISR